jgi:hypothetical protein
MKRLIPLLITLFLLSCECPPKEESIDSNPPKEQGWNDIFKYGDVGNIEHRGHQYIVFLYAIGSTRGICSIVHDPDCKKCREK